MSCGWNTSAAAWIMLLSLLNEPSDKRVYLIRILINMKPHFLLLGALGEDIIHQALSWVERFLFTRSTHSAWLSLTPVSLSYALPVILQLIKTCRRQRENQRWVLHMCAFVSKRETLWKKKIHGRGLKSSQTARFKKLPKIASKGRCLLVDVGKSRIDHQFFSLHGALHTSQCSVLFTSSSAPLMPL